MVGVPGDNGSVTAALRQTPVTRYTYAPIAMVRGSVTMLIRYVQMMIAASKSAVAPVSLHNNSCNCPRGHCREDDGDLPLHNRHGCYVPPRENKHREQDPVDDNNEGRERQERAEPDRAEQEANGDPDPQVNRMLDEDKKLGEDLRINICPRQVEDGLSRVLHDAVIPKIKA